MGLVGIFARLAHRGKKPVSIPPNNTLYSEDGAPMQVVERPSGCVDVVQYGEGGKVIDHHMIRPDGKYRRLAVPEQTAG